MPDEITNVETPAPVESDVADVFTYEPQPGSAGDTEAPSTGSSAPVVVDAAKPPVEPAPPVAVEVKSAAPVVPPVEAAKPVVEAPKPPVAATPVVPAPVQQPTVTRGQEVAAVKEQERKVVGEMTKHFALTQDELKLSKEEAEAFSTDPEKAIPAFLAKVLPGYVARCGMSFFYATQHSMGQVLPDLITGMLQQNNTQSEALNSFFGEYKALDKNNQDHLSVMVSVAKLYKEQHPAATPQETRKHVGKMAYAYFGLSDAPAVAAPVAAPIVPKPVTLPPHAPPRPGAAGAIPTPGDGAADMQTFFENLS